MAQPLVFAFEELLPWKTHAQGVYGGAYTEIVRELARRMDLPLEFRPCPLKRCLYMMESGEADIIIGVRDTPERLRYLHFLKTPYRQHSSDKVFYVQKEHGVDIHSYADLAKQRIGVTFGAAYFQPFDLDRRLLKEEVPTMEANFRKLALGRLDTVVVPEDQGEAQVARLALRGLVAKAPYRVADPSPRSIGISKKSAHAGKLERFEDAMAAMARDGTLAALFKRHYYEAFNVPPDSVQIK
ncbi:substrate-binding periplasmic protein [Pseudoduganella namucuonensis]|uniref:substrate-binding periplasmic protein n=1 Tax=Pseudoduganella namucuonensis TaxID=1035707 RepID=UPI0015A72FD4|nr:transporter substrate-binding domain-containing protein [Pseudoduganella namucuonensis]